MSRLVVICQKVDEADDLLGFFVGWLKEFAKHFDRVEVITLAKGDYWLPINVRVHSLGKERGASKIRQLLGFGYWLLVLTPHSDAVFAHMSPAFALIAWPFARVFRSRLVLWYLHRSVTFKLKFALRVCDSLVSADAASLNLVSPKIVPIGHGIDAGRFAVPGRRSPEDRPLNILSVGRLSPIKDFGTLIRAAAQLKSEDRGIQVRIVGRAVMPADRAYEAELHTMAMHLGLEGTLEFLGFIPYRDMPAQYAWADIIVGCTPKGGLDKAILEGMAAGCIPLTSNEAMRPYLEPYAERLVFKHGDPADLALRLGALGSFEVVSVAMVRAVRMHHDLQRTVRRIAELLQ